MATYISLHGDLVILSVQPAPQGEERAAFYPHIEVQTRRSPAPSKDMPVQPALQRCTRHTICQRQKVDSLFIMSPMSSGPTSLCWLSKPRPRLPSIMAPGTRLR
ncbi:hypothetical protein MRX96_002278 [Rhipicephalus microplus]